MAAPVRFIPCAGRDACKEFGDRCLGCGRLLQEIAEVHRLTDEVTRFVLEKGYENVDEFLDYLVRKVGKKLAARTS